LEQKCKQTVAQLTTISELWNLEILVLIYFYVHVVQSSDNSKMKGHNIFNNAEYANMHFVYRFCGGNATAASREYQHHYPDWRHATGHHLQQYTANEGNGTH
jgi:hypothetical protein